MHTVHPPEGVLLQCDRFENNFTVVEINLYQEIIKPYLQKPAASGGSTRMCGKDGVLFFTISSCAFV